MLRLVRKAIQAPSRNRRNLEISALVTDTSKMSMHIESSVFGFRPGSSASVLWFCGFWVL